MSNSRPTSNTRPLWTLDVGNSGAKLRRWQVRAGAGVARALEAVGAPVRFSLERLVGSLAALLDAEAPVEGGLIVAVSCVAASELEAQLGEDLDSREGLRLLMSPASGLLNRCSPPDGVGRDRLYAARGAFERVCAAAVVVDVGTAVTVDLLTVSAESGALRPCFEGGAIAPGPAMLARALHEQTARLPVVDVRGPAPPLGVDTAGAIAAGVFHGLRGGVKELVERISAHTQLPGIPIVVTGGGAAWLLTPELFLGRSVFHEPDLVHVGLAHAAIDAWAGAGGARGGS